MRLDKLLLPLAIIFITLAVSVSTNKAYSNDVVKTLKNIKFSQLTVTAQDEVKCLADNIYWESAYEPVDGRVGVALVTLNRVQDSRFT